MEVPRNDIITLVLQNLIRVVPSLLSMHNQLASSNLFVHSPEMQCHNRHTTDTEDGEG